MRSPRKYLRIGLLLILLFLVLEWGKTYGYGRDDFLIRGVEALGLEEKTRYFQTTTFTDSFRELIGWVRKNTGSDEVILSHYHLSPPLRAYTERGVNLTSLFESKPLRRKVEEFILALFGDEAGLYNFCRKYQADYLIYSIDTVLDESDNSWRYLAGRPQIDEKTVAFQMHFSPEKLANFNLLYENEFFRVYRVGRGGEKEVLGVEADIHPLIYRPDLFRRFSGSTSRFQKFVEGIYGLYLKGSRSLSRGDYEPARMAYEEVLNLVPDFPEPYAGLGAISENTGDQAAARQYYNEYLRLSPQGSFSEEIRKRIQFLSQKYIPEERQVSQKSQ